MGGGSSTAKQASNKALAENANSKKSSSDNPLQTILTEAAITGELDLSSGFQTEEEPIGQLLQLEIPQLESIPSEVASMLNLTKITLKRNNLQSIPTELGHLVLLKSINLSENKLVDLPQEIGNLNCLEELDISENSIATLPPSMGKLKNLTSLIAFKNGLTTLPDEFSGLVKLEVLNLYNNKLLSLGEGLQEITTLVEVNVGGNKLTVIPPVDKWTSLERLALHFNKITALPSFEPLCKLTMLQIHQNQIKKLPALGEMKQLTIFDANTNMINKVPSEVQHMVALKQFNLRKNRLVFFPAELGCCSELEILNLGGNPLSSPIPSEFGTLGNLQTLLLDDSNVTTLCPELVNLKKLIRCNFGSRVTVEDDEETKQTFEKLNEICASNGGWAKRQ